MNSLFLISRWLRRGFAPAAVLLILLCSAAAFAEDTPCRSKNGDVRVAYPEMAKRMKIAGVVRLQLQIDKNGGVREVKVLGGNPVLVSAAQDAVKSARFEGGDACVITFQFKE